MGSIIKSLAFGKANMGQAKELNHLLTLLFTIEKEFEPNIELQSLGLEKILSDPQIGEIFTCSYNQKIIAMGILLYSVSTALGGRVATLEDVIVTDDFRECGVGDELLTYILKYAKDSGLKRITVLTDDDNYIAQKLYKKHGFEKSSMIVFRQKLI
jgi:ribosomal protein S18 acetylase RimI-like enzyme